MKNYFHYMKIKDLDNINGMDLSIGKEQRIIC